VSFVKNAGLATEETATNVASVTVSPTNEIFYTMDWVLTPKRDETISFQYKSSLGNYADVAVPMGDEDVGVFNCINRTPLPVFPDLPINFMQAGWVQTADRDFEWNRIDWDGVTKYPQLQFAVPQDKKEYRIHGDCTIVQVGGSASIRVRLSNDIANDIVVNTVAPFTSDITNLGTVPTLGMIVAHDPVVVPNTERLRVENFVVSPIEKTFNLIPQIGGGVGDAGYDFIHANAYIDDDNLDGLFIRDIISFGTNWCRLNLGDTTAQLLQSIPLIEFPALGTGFIQLLDMSHNNYSYGNTVTGIQAYMNANIGNTIKCNIRLKP